MSDLRPEFRIGAVSYLNTVPLIWGMLHGEQQSLVDVSFSIPSICAAKLEAGETDIALVPVAEIARQGLEIVSDLGIACRGSVRSILLISRVPWSTIRTLAADLSSRTSVQLARVILREKFGVEPEIAEAAPDWRQMLSTSDAALVIGDPALRIEPDAVPYECLDLGSEWLSLTGLPMVFAAWAAKPGVIGDRFRSIAAGSHRYGMEHLSEYLPSECKRRDISPYLGSRYFAEHIQFRIGAKELEGLQQFWALSRSATSLAVCPS